VVSEDELGARLAQEVQDSRRVGTSMEQIPGTDESILLAQLEVLEQPGELLRAAVNVTEDPGRHENRVGEVPPDPEGGGPGDVERQRDQVGA
jgi:hypothetical protein